MIAGSEIFGHFSNAFINVKMAYFKMELPINKSVLNLMHIKN